MEDEARMRGIEFHLNEELAEPSASHLEPGDFAAFVDGRGSGWSVTGLNAEGSVVTYRIVLNPEAVGRQRVQAWCYVDDELADPQVPHGGTATSVGEWYQWIRGQDAAGNASTWARSASGLVAGDPRQPKTAVANAQGADSTDSTHQARADAAAQRPMEIDGNEDARRPRKSTSDTPDSFHRFMNDHDVDEHVPERCDGLSRPHDAQRKPVRGTREAVERETVERDAVEREYDDWAGADQP